MEIKHKTFEKADSVSLPLFMRDNVALSASRENSSTQSLHLHKLAIIF